MTHLSQDLRYALRSFAKSPGFAAIAIFTLALGIGANTAIFTVVNAVFFHAIPVSNPERLVQIFTADQRQLLGGVSFLPVSFPNAQDIQQHSQSFSGVSITTGAAVSMTIKGKPDQYGAQLVSGNFFDVLGVRAAVGRTFRAEEDSQPGSGPVVVLEHGFWERHFGGDENLVGQTVLLNGQGFTVIGVAPAGFQGTGVLGGPDMWIPMSMHDQILSGLTKSFFNSRRFLGFGVVARLKDGVQPGQAKAELVTMGSGLEHDYPTDNKGRSFTIVPLLESTLNPNVRGTFQRAGALLMTVVGIVLLVACFNIANLLLARASGRKREISIRIALGASRERIITQLLTEAMILAAAGGALGLGLAVLGRNLIWAFRPPALLQSPLDLSLDSHVLIFTFVVAIGTGLIFGLAPALQSSRPDLVNELKERSGGELYRGSRIRLRDVLVCVQVAICLVALVGAGMFLLSLRNAQKMDAGFEVENLGMINFDLGSLNYDAARSKEFRRRVLESIQALPGVKQATLSSVVPLFNGGFGRTVFVEGVDATNPQNGKFTQFGAVDTDYFQTVGIPLVAGRQFDSRDREDSPRVAILNETAARKIWPNESAIGKRFKFFGDTDFIEVVGIARDSKYNTLGEDPVIYTYVPLVQNPSPALSLLFRSSGDTNSMLGTVRDHLQSLDRNLPLTNVWPIGEVISRALWAASFAASLLSVFAVIAMLLCAVGIYGVVGYSVGQRVREIGIRMALGARRTDVLRLILRQSGLVVGVGLLAGLAASFALGRLIVNLLFGVSASSPLPFLGMAMLLAIVGFLASYIPARRAAAVDPMAALRNE